MSYINNIHTVYVYIYTYTYVEIHIYMYSYMYMFYLSKVCVDKHVENIQVYMHT